jgi:long-chain fatty acid transport protein
MPRLSFAFVLATLVAIELLPDISRGAGLQTVEQGTWDMGRAAVGQSVAADSAATAAFNPAGMSLFTEPEVTFGTMAILGETRFDPDSATTIGGGRGGNQSGNTVVPAGPFAVYPIDDRWAVGFSVTAPFVGTLDPDDGWVGRYQLTKLDLQVLRFGPSVSYRVNGWLSLGATVAMNYTTLGLRVAIPTGGADGGLRVSDADEWEPSWLVSAMLEPTETTRIGLVYFSELENDDLGGDLTVTGVGPGFASGVDVEFTLPQGVVASVRQEVTAALTMFASGAWADFSSFESFSLDTTGPVAVELGTHFRDTIAYGVAAEYELSSEWTWSAGISYASSPVRKKNRVAALPFDRQIRYGTGVRYHWAEDLTLGLSYEYLDLGSSKLSTAGPVGALSGEYHKNSVQFIALTLSKSF